MIVLTPVGKYVDISGMLLSSSASAITTFDSGTPFGCKRKSWFEVRAGLKGPPTKSLILGDQVHKEIEHYLKTGQNTLGKEASAGKGIIDELTAKYPLFQVETWIESFELDGVKIRGKVDFTGRQPGYSNIMAIIDWKTSSDIQKWGKTSSMLRKDTQMLLYRAAAETEGCEETLPMAHVYFGTVKRESEIVLATINRQQLADGLGDIKGKLAQMKQVMKITDSEEVEPDRTKCGSCPYSIHCPTKGASLFMSALTDRFKKPTVASTPVAPAITIPELKLDLDSVLPPDAPKSDPALAALPVEGFEPIPRSLKESPPAPPEAHNEIAVPPAPAVPVAARKRGRPAKTTLTAPAALAPPSVEVLGAEDFEINEITVNVGATVKAIPNDPKCFEFVRVDVALRATVRRGADLKVVREKVADMADHALVDEIAKRMPAP